MKTTRVQTNWPDGETLVLSCLKRGEPVPCNQAIKDSGMPRPTFQWYLRKLKRRYTIWTVYTKVGWCYWWQPNHKVA